MDEDYKIFALRFGKIGWLRRLIKGRVGRSVAVCLQLSRFSIMVPGPPVQTRLWWTRAACSLCISTFPRASANTSTLYTRPMPGLSGLRLTFPRTNSRLPWLIRTIFRWHETNKWPGENRSGHSPLSGRERFGFSGNPTGLSPLGY